MSLLINHFYQFGEFTLDTDQRTLLRNGKPLPLTPKVFDTLLILVENNGRVVTKEELMTMLWPKTFVEDSNLTFNIKQLRKSLGDDARHPVYIETLARRGYRFIADVEAVLTDLGAGNGHLIRQVEFATAAHPPDDAGLPVGEKNFTATPAPGAASRGRSKRSAGLAAALVIVLAVVGFVFWLSFRGPDKNSDESPNLDGKSPATAPLKFEKLTGTGQSRQVAISPDGKYVAYTRLLENKAGIWLRQLSTNTNVEIVPAAGFIIGLAFTNSGESIYFVRGDPVALYRVSLVGGALMRIVDKLEGNFSISSDDRQIAFIRQVINPDGQRKYSLVVADADGGNERTLFVGTYPGKLDVPLWSPGDQSILFSYGYSEGGGQDMSLVEVRADDGTKTELSSEKFFRITKMAWLPDKRGLLMSARKSLGDNNQLWRLSYPGMQIDQITEGLSSYVDVSFAVQAGKAVASQATRISDIWVGPSREPRNLKKITQATDHLCWAPDGQLIYSSTASGNHDLWLMEPDGAGQSQLTVDAAVDNRPAVTPDNRYVVFVSNRTGSLQLWRMDRDGSNQIRLTNGASKNNPAISPDGKWVLYNSTGDWHLWKISIDGGEPVPLTSYYAYLPSISPDGRWIACLGRNETKSELLLLPFEGGQPLKRFDFAGWSSRLQWTPDNRALVYAAERGARSFIMKQFLDGRPPKELAVFDEYELFDFGYSFDNQSLAVMRGVWQHDIVLISDINRQ